MATDRIQAEIEAYQQMEDEYFKEAERQFRIQRKFCWEAVLVKSKSILDKLSFDEIKELEMRIKNAACVTQCQNFEFYY